MANESCTELEIALNKGMMLLHHYILCWCLNLSTAKTTATAFHLNDRDSCHQLAINVNDTKPPKNEHSVYLGVTLNCSLTYEPHLEAVQKRPLTEIASCDNQQAPAGEHRYYTMDVRCYSCLQCSLPMRCLFGAVAYTLRLLMLL